MVMLSEAVGTLLNSSSSCMIGIRMTGDVEPSSFSRRSFYWGCVTLLKFSWVPALVPLANGLRWGCFQWRGIINWDLWPYHVLSWPFECLWLISVVVHAHHSVPHHPSGGHLRRSERTTLIHTSWLYWYSSVHNYIKLFVEILYIIYFNQKYYLSLLIWRPSSETHT